MCVGGGGEGGPSLGELIGLHCGAHWDGVSPLRSSLGSRVMCFIRACVATIHEL